MGTQFNVLLPASLDGVLDEVLIESEERQGSETIMIVDDEPNFLDVGREILEAAQDENL